MLVYVALFTTIVVLVAMVGDLQTRLDGIENKLGGSEKIAWNQTDTVNKVRASVVRVIAGETEGTGVAIGVPGYIVTNFHVIQFDPNPKIIYPDHTFETAEVIMADKDADLAIIAISREMPTLLDVESSKLDPAEELLAIGFPLGGRIGGEPSVSKGLFAGERYDRKNGVKYLQTDMTLIHGMSGGPLVNIGGEVVGILTSAFDEGGLGLAISTESLSEIIDKMGDVENPLKDLKRIEFKPNQNAYETVNAFYNYLKARRLDKAFGLLSENFAKPDTYEHWKHGYAPMLDVVIVSIYPDMDIKDRVRVKLATKDYIDEQIQYHHFEGYWDVRSIDGQLKLWDPEIKRVPNANNAWYDHDDMYSDIDDFKSRHDDFEKYADRIGDLWIEHSDKKLSLKELYEMAKEEATNNLHPISYSNKEIMNAPTPELISAIKLGQPRR